MPNTRDGKKLPMHSLATGIFSFKDLTCRGRPLSRAAPDEEIVGQFGWRPSFTDTGIGHLLSCLVLWWPAPRIIRS